MLRFADDVGPREIKAGEVEELDWRAPVARVGARVHCPNRSPPDQSRARHCEDEHGMGTENGHGLENSRVLMPPCRRTTGRGGRRREDPGGPRGQLELVV
jgi:hypothetical protein